MARKRFLSLVGVMIALAIIFNWHPPRALAYGAAEHPLAQLELSGNCDNPAFPLCAPPSRTSVGTGGIWIWIEIDAGGTGDVRGADCIHTVGGGGPVGATPIHGEITWTSVTLAQGIAGGGQFFGTIDPGNHYYLVVLPDGEKLIFPQTVGHYSYQPINGVSLQMQVAP